MSYIFVLDEFILAATICDLNSRIINDFISFIKLFAGDNYEKNTQINLIEYDYMMWSGDLYGYPSQIIGGILAGYFSWLITNDTYCKSIYSTVDINNGYNSY